MTRNSPARRALAGTALCVAALLPAGCGFNPATVPMPGAAVSGDTYDVHIQFASALNLPAQAKVMANGAKIGSLRSVTVIDPSAASPGRIDAVVAISSSVRIPRSSTAQLRQNTILGDIFIGLVTPVGDTGETIAPGGTIPLEQTKPALQVEDLLVGMSTFVGGGALHQVQEIINQANAALPQDKSETARIFDRMGANVEDLSGNLDVLDAALAAFQKDLRAVQDNPRELDALLSERGAVDIPADVAALVNTLGIVGSLGAIAESLSWLTPLLSAGDAAARAFVPLMLGDNPLDLSAPSNLNRLVALLRDKVVPYVEKGPKLTITGADTVSPVSTEEQVNAMVRALRMIGVVR
ncbi:MCE family protein [Nocardia sp. 2]|uniref:MCE family protein n=1 Tax=Nocardia acididurans TaxID=2802282 RepID=A0ABS1MFS2_9NOCA|nr:MlaD family protein [Nocardia acididurans]MBL1079406.1 MCE family protein [Nocardia acididurans]